MQQMMSARNGNARGNTLAMPSPRAGGLAAASHTLNLSGSAVSMANNNSANLSSSLPPKVAPQASKAGVPGKKVSKDSAIAIAFKNEIHEGCLNLSQRGIGDQQINEINKKLQATGYMRELDLSGNKITDSGVQHLAKAICEASLESLNLSNNKISDKSIEPLAATLRFAKGLKQLNLEGNGITNRVSKNKLKNSLTWMQIQI